jgi:hypothetical protein
LKKNVCNVSSQKSSRHDGKYKEKRSKDFHYASEMITISIKKVNNITFDKKGYFSSDLQPMLSYQPEKEEEVAQEIVVQGHFPSPETNMDIQQCFQQDKVFQSCLSSPENDVVVQFLNSLDTDEGFENISLWEL